MLKETIKPLGKTERKFLIFLRKNQKHQNYMSRIAKGAGTTYQNSELNLKKMQKRGLIEVSKEKKPIPNKYYYLTDKGKEVADNLIIIQKILE